MMETKEPTIIFEHALALLDLRELPEGVTKRFFLNVTASLVQRYGEDWLRQNRGWLVEELKYLVKF